MRKPKTAPMRAMGTRSVFGAVLFKRPAQQQQRLPAPQMTNLSSVGLLAVVFGFQNSF